MAEVERTDAVVLLQEAAKLVQRALVQLNTRSQPCKECSRLHFENNREAQVFKDLVDTPERLRVRARRLLEARQPAEPDPRD